jgi:hypothetical protein
MLGTEKPFSALKELTMGADTYSDYQTQCGTCKIRTMNWMFRTYKGWSTIPKKVQLCWAKLSYAELMMKLSQGETGWEEAWDDQILRCRQLKLNSLTLIIKLQRQAEKYNPVIVPPPQAIAICRASMVLWSPHPRPPNTDSTKNQTQKNILPFSGTSTCTNTQRFPPSTH